MAGLPLALELAATWTRTHSCAEIAVGIERSLDFVAAPLRDLPERHRSLRAVFEQSWRLLTTEERATLSRLAVFRGGFDRAAVETMEPSSLTALNGLIAKSLVREDDTGRSDLHPLLGQYAEEQLALNGATEQARAQHAAWCLSLAETAEPHLIGRAQAQWLTRLTHEQGNFRAALSWAMIDQLTHSLALRLSAALWRVWWLCGHLNEGRYWLDEALNAATPSEWWARRAAALHGAGVLAYHQNDFSAAERRLAEGLALCRRLRDRRGQANILNSLGMVALYQNQYAHAQRFHAEALNLRRVDGDRRGVMISLNNLALIAHYQENYAEAIELYEECVRAFEAVSDTRVKAAVLGNLGQAYLGLGGYDRALPYLQQSLKTDRALGSRNDSLEAIEALGRVAAAHGDGRRAAQLLGAVEAWRELLHAPSAPNARRDYERDVKRLRARLGERTFTAAWSDGRRLSLAQAIESALGVQANGHMR